MNKSYQPHEGHIPYLLQLFIDYNLYGMNLINLGAVKFRWSPKKEEVTADPERPTSCPIISPWTIPGSPKPNNGALGGTFVHWEENSLPSSLFLDGVERQSTCELEVDAVAVDILNRLHVETLWWISTGKGFQYSGTECQTGRNPGLQAIWEDEKQRRRENNQTSQIEAPESQGITAGEVAHEVKTSGLRFVEFDPRLQQPEAQPRRTGPLWKRDLTRGTGKDSGGSVQCQDR
ncbi:DNA polymerase zeta catalytic subunit-like [Nematolebias whitei]|uniref:DNA polymerase zeta catalytic subunit-like n=1 Tax=Nematolebias whitei TaxID=451745 RepID=UPI00189C2423|nr:DNA polymerase zeta catalytic subunit-like [Nematolebias whitei]